MFHRFIYLFVLIILCTSVPPSYAYHQQKKCIGKHLSTSGYSIDCSGRNRTTLPQISEDVAEHLRELNLNENELITSITPTQLEKTEKLAILQLHRTGLTSFDMNVVDSFKDSIKVLSLGLLKLPCNCSISLLWKDYLSIEKILPRNLIGFHNMKNTLNKEDWGDLPEYFPPMTCFDDITRDWIVFDELNLHHCKEKFIPKVKGGWSSWSPWQQCNAECGAGEKTRIRTCNNPVPSADDYKCVGTSQETIKCSVYCHELKIADTTISTSITPSTTSDKDKFTKVIPEEDENLNWKKLLSLLWKFMAIQWILVIFYLIQSIVMKKRKDNEMVTKTDDLKEAKKNSVQGNKVMSFSKMKGIDIEAALTAVSPTEEILTGNQKLNKSEVLDVNYYEDPSIVSIHSSLDSFDDDYDDDEDDDDDYYNNEPINADYNNSRAKSQNMSSNDHSSSNNGDVYDTIVEQTKQTSSKENQHISQYSAGNKEKNNLYDDVMNDHVYTNAIENNIEDQLSTADQLDVEDVDSEDSFDSFETYSGTSKPTLLDDDTAMNERENVLTDRMVDSNTPSNNSESIDSYITSKAQLYDNVPKVPNATVDPSIQNSFDHNQHDALDSQLYDNVTKVPNATVDLSIQNSFDHNQHDALDSQPYGNVTTVLNATVDPNIQNGFKQNQQETSDSQLYGNITRVPETIVDQNMQNSFNQNQQDTLVSKLYGNIKTVSETIVDQNMQSSSSQNQQDTLYSQLHGNSTTISETIVDQNMHNSFNQNQLETLNSQVYDNVTTVLNATVDPNMPINFDSNQHEKSYAQVYGDVTTVPNATVDPNMLVNFDSNQQDALDSQIYHNVMSDPNADVDPSMQKVFDQNRRDTLDSQKYDDFTAVRKKYVNQNTQNSFNQNQQDTLVSSKGDQEMNENVTTDSRCLLSRDILKQDDDGVPGSIKSVSGDQDVITQLQNLSLTESLQPSIEHHRKRYKSYQEHSVSITALEEIPQETSSYFGASSATSSVSIKQLESINIKDPNTTNNQNASTVLSKSSTKDIRVLDGHRSSSSVFSQELSEGVKSEVDKGSMNSLKNPRIIDSFPEKVNEINNDISKSFTTGKGIADKNGALSSVFSKTSQQRIMMKDDNIGPMSTSSNAEMDSQDKGIIEADNTNSPLFTEYLGHENSHASSSGVISQVTLQITGKLGTASRENIESDVLSDDIAPTNNDSSISGTGAHIGNTNGSGILSDDKVSRNNDSSNSGTAVHIGNRNRSGMSSDDILSRSNDQTLRGTVANIGKRDRSGVLSDDNQAINNHSSISRIGTNDGKTDGSGVLSDNILPRNNDSSNSGTTANIGNKDRSDISSDDNLSTNNEASNSRTVAHIGNRDGYGVLPDDILSEKNESSIKGTRAQIGNRDRSRISLDDILSRNTDSSNSETGARKGNRDGSGDFPDNILSRNNDPSHSGTVAKSGNRDGSGVLSDDNLSRNKQSSISRTGVHIGNKYGSGILSGNILSRNNDSSNSGIAAHITNRDKFGISSSDILIRNNESYISETGAQIGNRDMFGISSDDILSRNNDSSNSRTREHEGNRGGYDVFYDTTLSKNNDLSLSRTVAKIENTDGSCVLSGDNLSRSIHSSISKTGAHIENRYGSGVLSDDILSSRSDSSNSDTAAHIGNIDRSGISSVDIPPRSNESSISETGAHIGNKDRSAISSDDILSRNNESSILGTGAHIGNRNRSDISLHDILSLNNDSFNLGTGAHRAVRDGSVVFSDHILSRNNDPSLSRTVANIGNRGGSGVFSDDNLSRNIHPSISRTGAHDEKRDGSGVLSSDNLSRINHSSNSRTAAHIGIRDRSGISSDDILSRSNVSSISETGAHIGNRDRSDISSDDILSRSNESSILETGAEIANKVRSGVTYDDVLSGSNELSILGKGALVGNRDSSHISLDYITSINNDSSNSATAAQKVNRDGCVVFSEDILSRSHDPSLSRTEANVGNKDGFGVLSDNNLSRNNHSTDSRTAAHIRNRDRSGISYDDILSRNNKSSISGTGAHIENRYESGVLSDAILSTNNESSISGTGAQIGNRVRSDDILLGNNESSISGAGAPIVDQDMSDISLDDILSRNNNSSNSGIGTLKGNGDGSGVLSADILSRNDDPSLSRAVANIENRDGSGVLSDDNLSRNNHSTDSRTAAHSWNRDKSDILFEDILTRNNVSSISGTGAHNANRDISGISSDDILSRNNESSVFGNGTLIAGRDRSGILSDDILSESNESSISGKGAQTGNRDRSGIALDNNLSINNHSSFSKTAAHIGNRDGSNVLSDDILSRNNDSSNSGTVAIIGNRDGSGVLSYSKIESTNTTSIQKVQHIEEDRSEALFSSDEDSDISKGVATNDIEDNSNIGNRNSNSIWRGQRKEKDKSEDLFPSDEDSDLSEDNDCIRNVKVGPVQDYAGVLNLYAANTSVSSVKTIAESQSLENRSESSVKREQPRLFPPDDGSEEERTLNKHEWMVRNPEHVTAISTNPAEYSSLNYRPALTSYDNINSFSRLRYELKNRGNAVTMESVRKRTTSVDVQPDSKQEKIPELKTLVGVKHEMKKSSLKQRKTVTFAEGVRVAKYVLDNTKQSKLKQSVSTVMTTQNFWDRLLGNQDQASGTSPTGGNETNIPDKLTDVDIGQRDNNINNINTEENVDENLTLKNSDQQDRRLSLKEKLQSVTKRVEVEAIFISGDKGLFEGHTHGNVEECGTSLENETKKLSYLNMEPVNEDKHRSIVCFDSQLDSYKTEEDYGGQPPIEIQRQYTDIPGVNQAESSSSKSREYIQKRRKRKSSIENIRDSNFLTETTEDKDSSTELNNQLKRERAKTIDENEQEQDPVKPPLKRRKRITFAQSVKLTKLRLDATNEEQSKLMQSVNAVMTSPDYWDRLLENSNETSETDKPSDDLDLVKEKQVTSDSNEHLELNLSTMENQTEKPQSANDISQAVLQSIITDQHVDPFNGSVERTVIEQLPLLEQQSSIMSDCTSPITIKTQTTVPIVKSLNADTQEIINKQIKHDDGNRSISVRKKDTVNGYEINKSEFPNSNDEVQSENGASMTLHHEYTVVTTAKSVENAEETKLKRHLGDQINLQMMVGDAESDSLQISFNGIDGQENNVSSMATYTYSTDLLNDNNHINHDETNLKTINVQVNNSPYPNILAASITSVTDVVSSAKHSSNSLEHSNVLPAGNNDRMFASGSIVNDNSLMTRISIEKVSSFAFPAIPTLSTTVPGKGKDHIPNVNDNDDKQDSSSMLLGATLHSNKTKGTVSRSNSNKTMVGSKQPGMKVYYSLQSMENEGKQERLKTSDDDSCAHSKSREELVSSKWSHEKRTKRDELLPTFHTGSSSKNLSVVSIRSMQSCTSSTETILASNQPSMLVELPDLNELIEEYKDTCIEDDPGECSTSQSPLEAVASSSKSAEETTENKEKKKTRFGSLLKIALTVKRFGRSVNHDKKKNNESSTKEKKQSEKKEKKSKTKDKPVKDKITKDESFQKKTSPCRMKTVFENGVAKTILEPVDPDFNKLIRKEKSSDQLLKKTSSNQFQNKTSQCRMKTVFENGVAKTILVPVEAPSTSKQKFVPHKTTKEARLFEAPQVELSQNQRSMKIINDNIYESISDIDLDGSSQRQPQPQHTPAVLKKINVKTYPNDNKLSGPVKPVVQAQPSATQTGLFGVKLKSTLNKNENNSKTGNIKDTSSRPITLQNPLIHTGTNPAVNSVNRFGVKLRTTTNNQEAVIKPISVITQEPGTTSKAHSSTATIKPAIPMKPEIPNKPAITSKSNTAATYSLIATKPAIATKPGVTAKPPITPKHNH